MDLDSWELEKRVQGGSAKMSSPIQGNYKKSSRIAPADTPCSSEQTAQLANPCNWTMPVVVREPSFSE